jgi:histone H3/H4
MSNDDTPQDTPQEAVLPIATIDGLMRQWIPADARVSSESKELMRKCVVELIAFVTSEACDLAREEQRTTLTGDDIVRAARKLGFHEYERPLTQFLAAYAAAARPATRSSSSSGPVGGVNDEYNNDDDDVDDKAGQPVIVPPPVDDFVSMPLPDLGD